jgi:GxxExxY protein
MPVTIDARLRKLSQEEFGGIAYNVMRHAFDIHRELGRLFDERIYQAELAHRCSGARVEVPIEVSFRDFKKVYFIDLLVAGGAVFEVKTTEALHDRHRAQLLNYLLLTELAHGKLINFRPEVVEHEFVNTTITKADRTVFDVDDCNWKPAGTASAAIKPYLTEMLRDVGAGLDLELYEEAVVHLLGGADSAIHTIDVAIAGRPAGKQKVACTADHSGIKLTALKTNELDAFEEHYWRFLGHTDLLALHWINVNRSVVTFRTLPREHTKNLTEK